MGVCIRDLLRWAPHEQVTQLRIGHRSTLVIFSFDGLTFVIRILDRDANLEILCTVHHEMSTFIQLFQEETVTLHENKNDTKI